MTFEEEVIALMEKPRADRENWYSRDLHYMAIDLITEPFDESLLAEKAKSAKVSQRLGYLCDVTAEAARSRGLNEEASKLRNLAKRIYQPPAEWQYLDPHLPDFAKRIFMSRPRSDIDSKWKIYDTTTPEEIAEWIDLYILNENVAAKGEQEKCLN